MMGSVSAPQTRVYKKEHPIRNAIKDSIITRISDDNPKNRVFERKQLFPLTLIYEF
jgi:hypothetical protein